MWGRKKETGNTFLRRGDRYDESYDMMRAVRDTRFKYIRNYMPENPYLLWIPYRNRHPALQEMWRLHLSGDLKGVQNAMFQKRPVEELYDTGGPDPFEVNNLADDPAHAETLARLRRALDEWRDKYDTWGDVPEDQMVFRMWQGRRQPQTGLPVFVPICERKPRTTRRARRRHVSRADDRAVLLRDTGRVYGVSTRRRMSAGGCIPTPFDCPKARRGFGRRPFGLDTKRARKLKRHLW